MDPRSLYPDGYHPIKTAKSLDYSGPARHFTRTERPPRYYLIDLGIAKQYKPEERPPLERIVRGGDKSPPEHRTPDIPCDPFPTDIYYLGNLIRKEFLQVRSMCPRPRTDAKHQHSQKRRGFNFMRLLVADMVQDDPKKRPNIDTVAARFFETRVALNQRTLRSRPAFKNEFFVASALRDAQHWRRQFAGFFQGRPSLTDSAHHSQNA